MKTFFFNCWEIIIISVLYTVFCFVFFTKEDKAELLLTCKVSIWILTVCVHKRDNLGQEIVFVPAGFCK